MFFCNFDGLGADHHFFFHFFEPVNQLLLLSLRFLLRFFPQPNLIDNLIFFLLLQVGLILNLLLVFLSFLLYAFQLLLNLLLKLNHLLLVFNFYYFLDDITDDSFFFIHGLDVAALVEEGQLLLQFSNLILILSQQRILRILINLWLVFDVFGPISISQRIHRLIIVVIGRTNIGDHERLRVTSKGILQQPRKLRVSVRYVRVLRISEGRDNMTKRRQRKIDLRCLLETITGRACLRNPFTTCQIDHIKLTCTDMLLAVLANFGALDCNLEKRV